MFVTYRQTIVHTVDIDGNSKMSDEQLHELVTSSGVDSVEYYEESFEILSTDLTN